VVRRAEKIKDVLSRTLANLGLEQRLRESEAVRVFAEVVGEKIAAKAQAVSINSGVLQVRVPSSAWRQELNFGKAEIIEKLNAALGTAVVNDIYFT
jgi:predicted nucleic acid-binding Zn ribbon protein